jgi:hypothetical protein
VHRTCTAPGTVRTPDPGLPSTSTARPGSTGIAAPESPRPGNPRAKAAVGRATAIADGGYRGTGLPIPHRRERGQTELPAWKEEHNTSHRKVRARVEHVFARMKAWKILRDCRLKGEGVHSAMLGIARLHNLALTG